LQFAGVPFRLQTDENYTLSVICASEDIAGLDGSQTNATMLELLDTDDADTQLSFTDQSGGSVVVSAEAPSIVVNEAIGTASYRITLSSIPAIDGQFVFHLQLSRMNYTEVEGLAPMPVLGSQDLTVFGSSYSDPPNANWLSVMFDVTIPSDNAYFGPESHFGLTFTASDNYGSSMNGYEFPIVHVLQIADDDSPGLMLSASSVQVGELSPAVQYSISLSSMPLGDVQVNLTSDFLGSQVTITPSLLTFVAADWSVPQTVSVQAITDGAGAPDLPEEFSTIDHLISSADDPFYNSLNATSLILSVTDEVGIEIIPMHAGSMVLNPGGTAFAANLTEGGPANALAANPSVLQYAVRLTQPPVADSVTVTLSELLTVPRPISLRMTPQLNVIPASLVFTSSNFNFGQIVNVSVINDMTDEGEDTVALLQHSVSAPGDARFDGRFMPDVQVYISEDDVAGVQIVPLNSPIPLVEGSASPLQYNVTLKTVPAFNVAVLIDFDNASSVTP